MFLILIAVAHRIASQRGFNIGQLWEERSPPDEGLFERRFGKLKFRFIVVFITMASVHIAISHLGYPKFAAMGSFVAVFILLYVESLWAYSVANEHKDILILLNRRKGDKAKKDIVYEIHKHLRNDVLERVVILAIFYAGIESFFDEDE